jgi:hypothetical protein
MAHTPGPWSVDVEYLVGLFRLLSRNAGVQTCKRIILITQNP